LFHKVKNVVVLDVDVFRIRGHHFVSGEGGATLFVCIDECLVFEGISKDREKLARNVAFCEEAARAMCSASAAERATLCGSLLLHETEPPEIMVMYPVREWWATPSVKKESCR
jgi:hypothetical protein